MTENQKLREACNYIDALGGDSRSYRQALALPTAAPVGERDLPPLPSYVRWEERIKTLMQQCGHPNSMSIYQAFKQFQNEFEHEMIAYARAALSADDHEQSKPSVEFDLGETSSHTVKCVWSEWDAKANKLVLCLSVRDIETAAPVGERDLPPVIAYRLDYPASEGVGLPRFFGADDGDRAHTFAFNHKATITELCDRAALSAGDAVDAQRYRWLKGRSQVCLNQVWIGGYTTRQRDVDFLSKEDALSAIDAAIDAAIRKGQL